VAGRRVQGALVTARAAGTLGGALLLGASLLPWSGRGAGSSIALVRIADLVLSGVVDAWVPRWAGLVVYAIPLGGALLLLGTGLGQRAGALVGAAGVGLGVVGAALAGVALGRLDRAGLGPGALAAAAGLALGVMAVVASARTRA